MLGKGEWKIDIKHMFPITIILHDCYCFSAFIMNFSYKKWNKIVIKLGTQQNFRIILQQYS